MNILAIESSGRAMSVALRTDTGQWLSSVNAGFRHGETLMPAIDGLFALASLSPSELHLVACAAGPGSFTGLRIGMATAKGIARGAGCAIKAVPTLPLLADGREIWPGIVAPVMDARKKRVYAAAFRGGERIADDSDTDLAAFLDSLPSDEKVLVTGPDAAIAAEHSGVVIDPMCGSPRADFMIDRALRDFEREGGDPPDLGPVYIRLSEAEENLANTT